MTRKETLSTLNFQYERICTGYIDEFIKKQKINFDYNGLEKISLPDVKYISESEFEIILQKIMTNLRSK
jgi:hypothetical protein